MQPESLKDLVRRCYEALWNCWDFALADELISESVLFRGSLGNNVHGGTGTQSVPDVRSHAERGNEEKNSSEPVSEALLLAYTSGLERKKWDGFRHFRPITRGSDSGD